MEKKNKKHGKKEDSFMLSLGYLKLWQRLQVFVMNSGIRRRSKWISARLENWNSSKAGGTEQLPEGGREDKRGPNATRTELADLICKEGG